MKVSFDGRDAANQVQLLDDSGAPVEVVTQFLRHLSARGCSPNTISSYAFDLLHLWRFLAWKSLPWSELTPSASLELLEFLRAEASRTKVQRLGLTAVDSAGRPRLAPATVNRILTGVGSFYEWAIAAELFEGRHPIERRPDPAYRRVTARHRPFMGGASRQRSQRRTLSLRQPIRLPRPMSDAQVEALLAHLACLRDKAMVLLMLHGGLRPGEVLCLQLGDVAYGRRRVVIRVRDDHPGGVRPKSRAERVVDLFEAEALAAVSDYVLLERPVESTSPFVFLVGGKSRRRLEPLGYPAVARLFARAADRAGIREPWVTPHALRHTHATRMWEGGMRELTLQRRLGHASVESTRIYTLVSDHQVVTDYRRALDQDEATR
jgi:site-specific recombinase XerD